MLLLFALIHVSCRAQPFPFHVKYHPSNKPIEYCLCDQICEQYNTITGIVFDNKCFYLKYQLYYDVFYQRVVFDITTTSTMFEIIHMLTWHASKHEGVTHIRLPHTRLTSTMIRLPSIPKYTLRCPVYDVQSNILMDDVNCKMMPRIYAAPIFRKLKDQTNDMNDFFETATNDTGCMSLKYTNIEEEYVTIDEMYKYRQMCNLVFSAVRKSLEWFNHHRAFIVKYHPTNISLTNEYFMHIPDHTSYKTPSGCHIVDVKVGKIFQQPSCAEAERILRTLYYPSTNATRLVNTC
jgi:hypothetical protein